MPPASALDDLGRLFGSDRSSLIHDYLRLYERYLPRDADITLLDFGQNNGAALATWEAYFTCARIVGVFPDPSCRRFASPRVRVEIGYQSDTEFLARLAATYAIDVVVDDGLHLWDDQIACLKALYPALRPNGMYIIEDLHTSFGPQMHSIYGSNSETSTFAFVQNLAARLVDAEGRATSGDRGFEDWFVATTHAVHWHEKLCVLETRANRLDLIEQVPLEQLAETVTLDDGGAYSRRPGRIIGGPAWMQVTHKRQAEQVAEPPPARVARLHDATIHSRGIIMTSAGKVVAESMINTEYEEAFGPFRRSGRHGPVRMRGGDPVRHRLDADNVVLLRQMYDRNYGHWLLESLPRVGMVAEVCDLAACRFLIGANPAPIADVYRDTLALLGIGPEQIVALPDEAIFCRDLIYPTPITRQPWLKAPRAVRFVEALGARVPAASTPGPSRVYVSRNGTGSRTILNEPEVLRLAERHGYVVVEPQRLSFAEQVRMFRHAGRIIGNLGAGLTNVVFAPRGVRLLALTTEFMQDDFFWDLVAQRDGEYVSLHGRAADPAMGMQAHFTVDLDQFATCLDWLEGEAPA